ncbi:MAG: hypothetical protein HOP10_06245 [Chitinophagaceae bacterium]|nr:hypothetical protein [Chitinophagaceae bacterium]
MRNILCFVAAVLLIAACKSKDKNKKIDAEVPFTEFRKSGDSVLITDSTWGWIVAGDSIETLKELYGGSNIRDETICGPECVDSVDVTLVYPGSNREFVVYWEDSLYHKKIRLIRCNTKDAPYHTAGGIKIGTTLDKLVQMNGKPISFWGFGWDYGGTVFSLNHGVLENSGVAFRLEIMENTDSDVVGDSEFNSDMPEVKAVQDKIYISELLLRLQ